MLERFRRGVKLVQASWGVLRQDRELLFLPVLSALAAITMLAAAFFGLFWDDIAARQDPGPPGVGTWIVMSAVVYALSYSSIFFNVALICGADERMEGGDPTLGSSLREATQYARAIAPWAAITVVVSTVLNAIEEHGGLVGEIVAAVLNVAWGLVTFLVLPVMVMEGVGVRQAMRRSKDLFKRTWGETVSGNVGMSLVTFLAMLPAVLVVMLSIAANDPAILTGGIAVAVLWMALVVVVMSALNAVFRVVLYRWVTDGEAPAEFADVDLEHVFPPKGRRSR